LRNLPLAMTSPTGFAPFRNDAQVLVVSDGESELMLENGRDEIVLHGRLSLRRNEASLGALETLLAALRRVQREAVREG
jgi:hypothetical protein